MFDKILFIVLCQTNKIFMKKIQQVSVMGFLALFASSSIFAQNFQPMPVQSGFNADVIANGVGSSMLSTSSDVDGVSFAFVSKDFKLTATDAALAYGLPADGIVNSEVATTPGLMYNVASYGSNNSLKLSNQNDSGTLTFAVPKAAFRLYMLATSGSGASTVSVVVNFTDNTSQTFTGISISDWYNGSGFAIQGFGRINRTNDVLESGSGTNPRLYQSLLSIDAANQTKLIQSVTVTKTSTAQGYSNIFAFSADVYSDCLPPTVQPATNITATSATINWTASPSSTAVSYDVYYSTSPVIPTSATVPTSSNITGLSVPTGVLASNTTYYVWVRSNCNGSSGQSSWSFSGNFKTLCGPMAAMFENFDSMATGTNLPDCWVRNYVNGTMSISSTSPASGTRNVYQTNTSAQTPSTVVFPEFNNINAGTHWLKLKARVTSANGILNVGYVTNPSDASTFTLIQALNIPNTSYGPEYFVNVPNTVPANARLAIRNTADGKGYYWDDVKWEVMPACTPPFNMITSNASPNSVDVTWGAAGTGAANGYEYYYSPVSTVSPIATTTVSGTFSPNSVNGIVTGLVPNHTYSLWIRTVCSATEKSEWSGPVIFRTTCAPGTSLFEDFESYTATSIVPDCWARIVPSGSQTITSTSPASGIRNIYQYASASNTPSVVILPEFSNVNANTHRLRFKARVATATGNLQVGYVTSTTDASTFVSIESLSIPNTSYGVDYIVDVPATVPATARLAIRNANDAKAYYWDDIYWEPKNSLSVAEVSSKKKVSVYPNPFNDVLFVSDTENIKTIKITDVSGRVLKVIDNPTKGINLNSLNAGLYLVTMYFKDGSVNTVKAIKK